ncbi:MAG: tetratricopeptide repeat protein [bacterium]
MLKSQCESCGQEKPMNHTFLISGKVYCQTCADKALKTKEFDSESDFIQQVDPTICVNCEKDNGTSEFSLLVGFPACHDCINFFRNRPFPGWIKTSFVGVVAFVILSLLWNLRFIQAYKEMSRSFESFDQGDLQKASALMSSAAQRVPESEDLQMLAHYTEGLRLLYEGQSAEAQEEFLMCGETLPEEYNLDVLILQAEKGARFDSQDYDGFLRASKELAKLYPDDAITIGSVASAYACKYAISNDEKFKVKALDWLSKAQQLAGDDEDFREYENRIQFRLYSQEIISNDEFKRRFPNGWNNLTEK